MMTFFGNDLDNLIDRLEHEIPHVDEGLSWGFSIDRHDWRPVWSLCKEIQDTFRGYKGYPSREKHQAAWDRFQELRKRASRLADVEKEKFAGQSDRLKDEILYEAKACYWSMSADFFVGSILGETTVDEMKELQTRLNGAGRKLSENKALMTKADKEECFEAIKDARESHDRFWEKYKAMSADRRAAGQQRREEFEQKRSDWLGRVRANIASNRDKLAGARGALERTRDRIEEIEGKISDTDSAKWEGIFSEWLDEARDKERNIEESIERIEGWISEDEDKLNSA
jgi:hypothetical protein